MMLRALVAGLGMLAALSCAASAQGAIIRGRALQPDSTSAASGAIVEAVLTTDGAVRVRALVGRSGAFTLRLPRAGTWRLMAMRVGYFPTSLGTVVAEAGATHTVAAPFIVTSSAVTAVLATLQVDTTQICGRGDESSRLTVATLLAQARSALAATTLSSPDGEATAQFQRFSMFTDRLGTPLTPMWIDLFEGATDRPFRAVNADSLARDGYLWDRTDHAQFNAPDAQVLLSESFVESHCYRMSAAHPEHPEWIGVTFTPARQRRAIVEVRGTLWLDRASGELRELEYHYVDLPASLESSAPRGRVEFARLPSDVWVVRRWEMRLPRVGNVVSRTGDVSLRSVRQYNAIMLSGGDVASVRRGDAELYRSEVSPAERFPELAERLGKAPACVDAPTPHPTERGIVYGVILDTLGRPLGGMARIGWASPARIGNAGSTRELNVSAIDGLFIFCGVGVGPTLTLIVFDVNGRASDPLRFRLNAAKLWSEAKMTVR